MRFLFFFLFFLTSFFSISQKRVGVFYAGLRVDAVIMNDLLSVNPPNGVTNRYTKKALFPQYILDSLHAQVLNFASLITKGKAEYIYKITEGDTVFTFTGGEIEGFPRNSKKGALPSNCDEYLDIRFNLLSMGGSEIRLPNGKQSRLKPSLRVTINRLDKMGVQLNKYVFNFTDFQWKQGTKKTIFVKGVVDRRQAVLHPEELYVLIMKGLDMTQEKIQPNE
ncbi:MAG: hypothetical protein K9G36_02580 [Crocinitomicaceae bacterium]|nr:hypothetical protein [Crocinitomicaceae bacterium]MCF8410258.1 hypothetical protein [Crocinitomicaceae bacterium]MCF8444775.1 hypothetical protein [Crocinitomicaceae bacterium]